MLTLANKAGLKALDRARVKKEKREKKKKICPVNSRFRCFLRLSCVTDTNCVSEHLLSSRCGAVIKVWVVSAVISNTIPRAAEHIEQGQPELCVEEHVNYRVVDNGSFGHQLWNHGVCGRDTFVSKRRTHQAGESVWEPADEESHCHGNNDLEGLPDTSSLPFLCRSICHSLRHGGVLDIPNNIKLK